MRRRYLSAGIMVLVVTVPFISVPTPRAFGASTSPHIVHRQKVTSFDSAKLTAICDRLIPGASLGLSTPTFVSRTDHVDAVIFATSSKYTACIVTGANGVSGNQPTPFVHSSKAVTELESFATLNKIPGRSLFTTDTWFLVRVAPNVSTLKAVTRGTSQASAIGDGFAFIHEKETAAVRGKFLYGVATVFSAGGEFLGSTTLS